MDKAKGFATPTGSAGAKPRRALLMDVVVGERAAVLAFFSWHTPGL